MHRGAAFLSVGKGVGLEALHGQVVGQAERGLAGGEGALVACLRGGKVEPDGQRLSVGEAEVVARPAVVLLVIIHIVRLRLVGLAVKARPLAQHLCPVAAIGAVALQLICHFAALELLLDYPLALRVGEGVEIVAVVERGVRGEGVAAFGIVRAGVEAVVEGAGGVVVLATYETAHALPAVVGGAIEIAGHDAVFEGDFAFAVCREHHSCGAVGAVRVAVSDFHIADAARESGVAIRIQSKYAQSLAVGRHLPRYAQVLDGGICYRGEQRDVGLTAVNVPIDRDGVPLSVEGAGIAGALAAYFQDLRAEVKVGGELGVEFSLPGQYEVAERPPVFFRGDADVFEDHVCHHGGVAGNGGGRREAALKAERVGNVGSVVSAEQLLHGGQADGLTAVGVAHDLRLVVEGELHLVHLFRDLGGGLRNGVGAEHLSPHGFLARALQLMSHIAVLELLLGYLRALCFAAGVEVVAIVEGEGGRGGSVRGEGTVSAGVTVPIVRAGVEAVVHSTGAVIGIYKSAHAFLSFVGGGVDIARDETVADGNATIGAYIGNQASSPASVAGIAARDVHRADAVRDGVAAAIGFVNQSAQKVTVRTDGAFGAQVLDGGAIHSPEGGDVVDRAGIPVDGEHVVLSVERAGIGLFGSSHHRDVGAEVHVLRQLGVEGGLSAVHEGAELLPVGGRGDGEGASHGYVHALVFRYGRGGGEVAEVERVSHLRVVARTEEFLCCGQRDGLSAVGVAHGLYLAVVGELYLIHPLLGVGGELRLVVGAEGLSPHLRLSALLQLIGYVAVLQLRLGDLIALHFAAGVEVVAVGEGGADALFRAEGVAESIVGGVVRADVEAASQRVGAIIRQDKTGHRSIVFIRIVGDAAFDEAVGDLNRGTVGYRLNHACGSGIIPTTVSPRDVHVADAARDGGGAQGYINHSGQAVTLRRDLPLGAQVLDRGVLHIPEGGDLVIFARIPVELQRMAVAVERAGVRVAHRAHHHDFLAEVHVSRQLGVEEGLAVVVHALAKRFPVGSRGDAHYFGALRPRRHRQHEGKQEEAEPLNDVCCFHINWN